MQELMLIGHLSRDQAHLTIRKGRDNYATASRSVRIVKCELPSAGPWKSSSINPFRSSFQV
ncbi:hypothetical protein N7455_012643 [Penicillium solitum]|uniref:uncharacterized protein n=1 Tax=Penicillium solitum TaxID=60172 RepID=UPI0032C42265|nr:hypothetical protein N7455_012643 [Penicillium solitum]